MHHIYVLLLKNPSWDLSDFASFVLNSLNIQFISIFCPIQNLKIWIWGRHCILIIIHKMSSLSKNKNFCSKYKHVAFYPFKFTIHVFKVTSSMFSEFPSVLLERRNRDSKWIAKFDKNTKEYEQIGISNFFTCLVKY